MNADEQSNASVSAKTSPNEPRVVRITPDAPSASREQPRSETPRVAREDLPQDLSEAELLQREAETAKAAMVQTLRDLQEELKRAADLRTWTREHPWTAVGVAAATGFAAAAASSSACRTARDDRERSGKRRKQKTQDSASAPQAGAFGWLWGPLFDLAKTAVTTAVAGALQSTSPFPSSPNGRAEAVVAGNPETHA